MPDRPISRDRPADDARRWCLEAARSQRDGRRPDLSGLRDLDGAIDGEVVLPGDATWDTARQAWNLAVDQRPVAVVYPASADDVAATVRAAAAMGVRIAFNAGGHNAGPIDWGRDTLLLKTGRMQGIEIDASRGVLGSRPACWRSRWPSLPASMVSPIWPGPRRTSAYSGTRSVAGSAGWSASTASPATAWSRPRSSPPTGGCLRVDRDVEPELFWALRGGGGNVAAVTAIELELFPVPEIYAGALFWPIERAAEVLHAWRDWIGTVPETCESLGRMLQLPDVPFLPEPVRGRSFVLVEAALIGSEDDGAALLQPLRDLGPEMDTVALMPTSELSLVNMDPDFPLPYSGEGILLTDLPPAGIDRLVEAFVGSPLLHVEVRHLGGAAARRSADHGVLDAIDQPFVAFTFGLTPDADALAAVEHHVRSVLGALGRGTAAGGT